MYCRVGSLGIVARTFQHCMIRSFWFEFTINISQHQNTTIAVVEAFWAHGAADTPSYAPRCQQSHLITGITLRCTSPLFKEFRVDKWGRRYTIHIHTSLHSLFIINPIVFNSVVLGIALVHQRQKKILLSLMLLLKTLNISTSKHRKP